MIQIASQPLAKSYVAGVSSRSFFVSYFCYILVLILPATILVNIQYSWPSYKRQLIQPTLQYYAYQISCLDSVGNVIYNSNLQSGIEPKDYFCTVGVGVQNNNLAISGQVFYPSGLKSCSVQVYMTAKLENSAQVLTHLPLNFATSNEANFLSNVDIKGSIYLRQSTPLSQSSLLSINQTQLGSYPYSFSTNFRDSGGKSIMLNAQTLYNKISLTTSPSSFKFTANFRVNSETTKVESSLIEKLRVFIPVFMYLCLMIWWLVVDPLINWMLRNKVYSAKTIYGKFKRD